MNAARARTAAMLPRRRPWAGRRGQARRLLYGAAACAAWCRYHQHGVGGLRQHTSSDTGSAMDSPIIPPASQAAHLPMTRASTSTRLSLGLLLAVVFWTVASALLLTLWLASQLLA